MRDGAVCRAIGLCAAEAFGSEMGEKLGSKVSRPSLLGEERWGAER